MLLNVFGIYFITNEWKSKKHTMKTILITSFAISTLYLNCLGQEQNLKSHEEQKIQKVLSDPTSYQKQGGVIHDVLLKHPERTKQVKGDGFIIHSKEDEDFHIHELNTSKNQNENSYRLKKENSINQGFISVKIDENKPDPNRTPQIKTNK